MKKYKYKIIETERGREVWTRQTNDKNRAKHLLTVGMFDDTGNIYQCYFSGICERKLYIDGRERDPESLFL